MAVARSGWGIGPAVVYVQALAESINAVKLQIGGDAGQEPPFADRLVEELGIVVDLRASWA